MASTQPEEADALEAISSLGEPLRRALYELVVASGEPVSRDLASTHLGVSRQVAAYHLDRLADDGLLVVEYRRLGGRVGPGAGRPSKLYSRSELTYQVSLPPRRYDLAAQIMLTAIEDAHVGHDVLTRVAHRLGADLAGVGLEDALASTGYEPAAIEGEIRFRNCPFHLLREQDRAITCDLNLALVEGMLEGSGSRAEAVLAPEDGYCCVRLRLEGSREGIGDG